MNKTMVYHSVSATRKSGHFEEACKKGEVVHSGHFMISSVADDQEDTEDINHGRDSPIYHEHNRMIQLGYDFSKVAKETKNTYQFGPLPTNQITIDASLARLFQCMSLAYQGGKVVSPKWKNFKGMKLTVKDKIRLNNAIWRTWHIQYVMRKRKDQSLIQFATPMEIDYNSHARPEAVVMEGKYWKRRIETVVAEYKKWRAFFMNKLKLSDYPGLWWVSDSASHSPSKPVTEFEKPRTADDAFINDFSDTLFSSLSQQPIQFPNPREIAMHATNSDMMQPGLLQLQPTVDDYMDFDSFHEWLNPPKKPMVSFAGASNQVFPPSDNEIFGSGDFASMLESSPIQQPAPPAKVPDATNNQSMELVTNFEMQAKAPEVQFMNQLTPSGDSPMFSNFNNVSAPSYPTRRIQQQSPPMQQMPSTAPNTNQVHLLSQFNQVQQPKMYPINNDIMLQQQQQQQQHQQIPIKPNQSGNGVYVSSHNIPTPVVNNGLQQPYPHSKLTTNSTSNRVLHSQPQVEYFSQNQSPVLMQQNATNAAVPQAHHMQPRQHALHGGGGVSMNQAVNPTNSIRTMNGRNKAVGDLQQQQPQPVQLQQTGSAVNIGATTSNVILLKQLITNTNTSFASPNHPRRINKNQEIRSKPVQQMPTLGPPVQKSSQPMVDIIPGVSQGSKCGLTTAVVEKRRIREENLPALKLHLEEPWPQTNFSDISSPVKSSSVQDVDMEQMTFESVSPTSQDADISQLAALQRRGSFSTTEQKRRFNIKIGFARMQKLLPGGNSQSNAKTSKATLMGKAVQYITAMQAERRKMAEEIRKLKEDMESLQLSINASQQQLPASGAPVPRQRSEEAKIQFRSWARQRTRQDWKFYLFGVMVRPWFESYQKEVSVRCLAEFNQSVFEWLETHCSLPVLRPSVVQALQVLSTTTNILTNPSQLRQQIEEAVSDRHQAARPTSSKST